MAKARIVEAVRLNLEFHRRVAELAASPIALQTLDRLWDRIQVSTQSSLRPIGRADQVAGQHRELLAALAAGDPETAHAAARRHVLDTCATTIRDATTRDEE